MGLADQGAGEEQHQRHHQHRADAKHPQALAVQDRAEHPDRLVGAEVGHGMVILAPHQLGKPPDEDGSADGDDDQGDHVRLFRRRDGQALQQDTQDAGQHHGENDRQQHRHTHGHE